MGKRNLLQTDLSVKEPVLISLGLGKLNFILLNSLETSISQVLRSLASVADVFVSLMVLESSWESHLMLPNFKDEANAMTIIQHSQIKQLK